MLDLLYAQAVAARRRWFERHPEARRRLHHPVISVGNLSVGGTGKTPLVAQLAAWCVARGERPAVLTRGYGRLRRQDGVVVVSDGSHVLADLDRAGDEPLMLARAVPGAIVAVAEDRYLAGLLAERQLGATVHLLDDGFQHLQLARDLDILMTSPGEIAGGRVMPFGRLREGADAAARAHVLVVVGTDLVGARAEAWTLGISQAVGARRTIGRAPMAQVDDSGGGEPDGSVVAVAGIGQPAQFFGMLREAGYRVVETVAFPDHHRYRRQDVDRIAAILRDTSARVVVTTEKDLIRLHATRDLPFACDAVPMTLEIDGWDELIAAIDATLTRVREAA